MRALLYSDFNAEPAVREVPDPDLPETGVIVAVGATGVCRSDWHGWAGHDPEIQLPHVPGHEFAGTVLAVGSLVRRWSVGDRVTTPFALGCGSCGYCVTGRQNLCDEGGHPGFTYWGSFAQRVAVPHADTNLVRLPDGMDFATAASLGCRFVTSFRAVVDRGRVGPGEWVAVHGCGGVGLSAIMIARALGARVVAVDITSEKLSLAKELGADVTIDASSVEVVAAIREVTDGGAHVSIEALGNSSVFLNSVRCLRKQGRHVQVGLMMGEPEPALVPMDEVLSAEIEIVGSYAMPAHRYGAMLEMIESGLLAPERLIGQTLTLAQAGAALMSMEASTRPGVSVVVDLD